jgi:hypothetical protein
MEWREVLRQSSFRRTVAIEREKGLVRRWCGFKPYATPLIAAAGICLALLWPVIRLLNHLERRSRPADNIPSRR